MEELVGTTLLIVDDAVDAGPHVSAILRQMTHETVALPRNEVRKLNLVNSGAGTVCLAARMSLPEGVKLLSSLRADTGRGPVRTIVVTAAVTRDTAVILKESGIEDLLVIPFKPGALIERMAA